MKKSTLFSFCGAMMLASATLHADVREGIVSYWPLDEVGWTSDFLAFVTPDVAYTNDMAANNIFDESVLVPGKFGQAISLDQSIGGAEQFFSHVSPAGVDTGLPVSRGQSWTVAMWVKGDATQTTPYNNADRRVYCESDSLDGNNNPLMAIGTRGGGNAEDHSSRIYIRNSGPLIQEEFSTGPAANAFDDTWRHIALVADPENVTLYVDGELDFTVPHVRGSQDVNTTTIGGILRTGDNRCCWFQGLIDDVITWERSLSQAEVQEVMTNSISLPIPPQAPAITADPQDVPDAFPGDTVNLTVGVTGSRPLSFQWYKNDAQLAGENGNLLSLVDVGDSDSGDYFVVVANSGGSVTSAVATVSVLAETVDLNDGMIAYWPLDEVVGTKTPDLVSGYDMNLGNMSAADLVTGRFSKAFEFKGNESQALWRIDNEGEDIPIYYKPDFTIAMWVNGATGQRDKRVFSEGNTGNNQPLFNIGTHNGAADGTLDSYIRADDGASANHQHGSLDAFDSTWHHVVYIQRTTSSGLVAEMYVDGQKDTIVPVPQPNMTLNTTSIGAILRGGFAAYFTGMIDEVVLWERALFPAEITALQTQTITDPPNRQQPLAINTFRPDFPAVVKGQDIVLRWDVSKDASQVTIDPIGDVTADTTAGAGSKSVNLTETTEFVMTISRGADSLSATSTVAVVEGVQPDWVLLDNFETYEPGFLADSGDWFADTRGRQITVENVGGNNLMNPAGNESAALMQLWSHTIDVGKSATLFFRFIPRGTPAGTLMQAVGLTEVPIRWYGDTAGVNGAGPGPAVKVSVVTNEVSQENEWLLGVNHDSSGGSPATSLLEYDTNALAADEVYSVWIDVTNVIADYTVFPFNDVFSVHIQKEGDPTRTTVFDGYLSDRDPEYVDPVLPVFSPVLDKLFVSCNSTTDSALFDDFYLSTGGYNSTVPKPLLVAPPAMTIGWEGADLLIGWDYGDLYEADSPTGPWTKVEGAVAPSHTVTPSEAQKYYRAASQ